VDIENRIVSLGLSLVEAPDPAGNYIGAVTCGNLVYLSGHGPSDVDAKYLTGKVPSEVSTEEAYNAARMIGLNMLATLKSEIGDLDKVNRFIKVLGMVNADPNFEQQPYVINGFSDLMVDIFGNNARCARSAVGMGSLPFNIPVEIEAIVELK